MHENRLPGRGEKAFKQSGGILRKSQRTGFEEIIHGPAAHNAVEAEQKNRCDYGNHPRPAVIAAGGKFSHCAEGAVTASSANHAFRQENWNGKKGASHNVHKNKGRTPVLAHQIGKSPDITKADGRSRHG